MKQLTTITKSVTPAITGRHSVVAPAITGQATTPAGTGHHSVVTPTVTTFKEFLRLGNRVHGYRRYDYSQVHYVDLQTKILIGCSRCGDRFRQFPINHLQGKGCLTCAGEGRTHQDFLNEAAQVQPDPDRYRYLDEYQHNRQPIRIRCGYCEEDFEQLPDHHLLGYGCPYCTSRTEGKLRQWLRKTYPKTTVCSQWSLPCLPECPFDFYLPQWQMIIEVDGPQHFAPLTTPNQHNQQCHQQKQKELRERQQKDIQKMVYAMENGISIVRLSQKNVWKDRNHWEERLQQTITKIRQQPRNGSSHKAECYFLHDTLYSEHLRLLRRARYLRHFYLEGDAWLQVL